jgi:hypothetical protein
MAILPSLEGAEVYVRVNNQALPEFQDPDHEETSPNEITRYVQAVTGATFDVEVRSTPRFKYCQRDITVKVFVDGAYITGKILGKEHMLPRGHSEIVAGLEVDQGNGFYVQELKFAEFSPSSDPKKP